MVNPAIASRSLAIVAGSPEKLSLPTIRPPRGGRFPGGGRSQICGVLATDVRRMERIGSAIRGDGRRCPGADRRRVLAAAPLFGRGPRTDWPGPGAAAGDYRFDVRGRAAPAGAGASRQRRASHSGGRAERPGGRTGDPAAASPGAAPATDRFQGLLSARSPAGRGRDSGRSRPGLRRDAGSGGA